MLFVVRSGKQMNEFGNIFDPQRTWLMGDTNATYNTLVHLFGYPTWQEKLLGHQKDAEWVIYTAYGVVMIYNWKNGRNYLGDSDIPFGLEVRNITLWMIDGHNTESRDVVFKIINERRTWRGVST